MKSWFVVQTKRYAETQAAFSIAAAGFETLTPTITTLNKKRDKIVAPMFPSYIFARFDLTGEYWFPIAYCRGVKKIMGDPQGKPLPLREEVVQFVRKRDGSIDSKMQAVRDLKLGDTVRIEAGPFTGFEGLFAERAEDRVWVLLDFLGQKVRTELSDLAISAA